MEFDKVIQSRHSVRDFCDKQVPQEVLTDIVHIAQATPTWVNSQPVKVYMITGEAAAQLRASHEERVQAHEPSHSEIAAMSREQWPERHQEIMKQWTVEFKQQFEPGQVHFNHAQKVLFNAPAFAYLTVPAGIFDWALFDAGAFANSLMLAAKSRGVDSIAAYSTVIFPEEVRSLANIPNDEMLVVGIALGYASDNALNTFVPTRVDVHEIVQFIS
ncbi:nitroreductase [Alloscardovia omnicolens]|uniref:nitroreductase n=1 Tax=Alloscardovia omnicolens TaxID=419015 RepID=UPI003A74E899